MQTNPTQKQSSAQKGWWRDDQHGAAWERAKPEVSRSWGQARAPTQPGGNPIMGKDLGGTIENAPHGRGQSSGDGQGNGTQASAEDTDSLRFGVGARRQYGDQHPSWSPELEKKLQTDWQAATGQSSPDQQRKDWNEAKYGVRHGYEYNAKEESK